MCVSLLLTPKVVLTLQQYRGWDPDKAVQDYYTRIRDHEEYYEPVEEKDWPFIRIINVRRFHNLIEAE